jgi:hypothetical protein
MTDKKTKKKHRRLKKTGANKRSPANRPATKRLGKKNPTRKKKLAKKKPALKKAEAKTKTAGKKTAGAKTVRTPKRGVPARSRSVDAEPFELRESRSRSAGQSGDLQGLSDVEAADSESVDELIEEGNAFEAGVVSGVENAGKRGDREVRTQEVPEDDVPGEYLDEE